MDHVNLDLILKEAFDMFDYIDQSDVPKAFMDDVIKMIATSYNENYGTLFDSDYYVLLEDIAMEIIYKWRAEFRRNPKLPASTIASRIGYYIDTFADTDRDAAKVSFAAHPQIGRGQKPSIVKHIGSYLGGRFNHY